MAKIDIDNADAYFAPGKHHLAQVWLKFDRKSREGAVVSARRAFERALGREMDEADPPAGSRRNDAYAVFEQALWILLGTPYSDAANGSASARAVLKGRNGNARPAVPATATGGRSAWSYDALNWLGGVRNVLVRG